MHAQATSSPRKLLELSSTLNLDSLLAVMAVKVNEMTGMYSPHKTELLDHILDIQKLQRLRIQPPIRVLRPSGRRLLCVVE